MDDVIEPPSPKAQSFGHSFDPGPVEEPVRSDQETEVSVGKTHGDPSALPKRGVGHLDGSPSSAHHTTQGLGTQVGYLGAHDATGRRHHLCSHYGATVVNRHLPRLSGFL